jgi:hypothetical protein
VKCKREIEGIWTRLESGERREPIVWEVSAREEETRKDN